MFQIISCRTTLVNRITPTCTFTQRTMTPFIISVRPINLSPKNGLKFVQKSHQNFSNNKDHPPGIINHVHDEDHNDKEEDEEVENEYVNPITGERGGRKGPEPTRYGDWEKGGRCIDF